MPRVFALSVAAAVAVARGGDTSGEAVLRSVDARLAPVHDYTVTLDVVADIERLNVPPMHATMYFKQPDKIHLDAEGFALLPREGLQPEIGKLLSRYNVAETGSDTLGGVPVRRVTLQAKSERGFPRMLSVYVDPRRWTTERIVTKGSADRVATITFSYIQVDGVWLPGEMTAAFSIAQADSLEGDLPAAPMRPQQMPRKGTVTVRFSEYRLNTGLNDEIFTKDPLTR
jgi:outer membrane lipoprotein-sorting protein